MAKEADILAACKRYLTTLQGQGFLVFRRINVSPIIRNDRRGRPIFTKNPDMRGLPDLLVWVTGGPQVCVEVKGPDGRLRDDQQVFREELIVAGHKYHVVRSLDDLIGVLALYGIRHWSTP